MLEGGGRDWERDSEAVEPIIWARVMIFLFGFEDFEEEGLDID